MTPRRICGLIGGILLAAAAAPVAAQPPAGKKPAPAGRTPGPSRPLVRVDGEAITQADLDRLMRVRRIPDESKDRAAPVLLEQIIDQKLIRKFLNLQKIEADADEVARQYAVILDFLKKDEPDAAAALRKAGYTEQALREEIALPLRWQAYALRTITEEEIAQYFKDHKPELDGTKVRVRRIFVKVPQVPSTAPGSPPAPDEMLQAAARDKLARLRRQIVQGTLSFEEAARKHSESPTREQGGDVGFVAFNGRLPEALVREAFRLKVDEISEPITTPFGVDLLQVTERIPGELSLEDARREILPRLSAELWKKTTAALRGKARIERLDAP